MTQDYLRKRLDEVARTKLRRMMWKLMDGTRSTIVIAERVEATPRAVQLFVKDLEMYDLVEMPKRGYPRRTVSIPPGAG